MLYQTKGVLSNLINWIDRFLCWLQGHEYIGFEPMYENCVKFTGYVCIHCNHHTDSLP